MARQHAGTAVISERHKEVINIRTAGAASKCSANNAIRIRIFICPNSLKPLFGTPLLKTTDLPCSELVADKFVEVLDSLLECVAR